MRSDNTRERTAIYGYVMAGGASSRFGADKASAELGGMTMLTRTRELMSQIAASTAVIAAPGRYRGVDRQVIADIWPGEGPLGGIITGLMSSRRIKDHRPEWNLIVGCDMPFLTREWLAYLAQRALVSEAEVIAPLSPQGLEPLCACWRTSAGPKLLRAFEEGVRKITDAMKRLKVEIVDAPDWKRFDSAGRLFWNMNTPADYQEAKRIVELNQA